MSSPNKQFQVAECHPVTSLSTSSRPDCRSLGDWGVVVMAEYHAPMEIDLRNCSRDGAQLTLRILYKEIEIAIPHPFSDSKFSDVPGSLQTVIVSYLSSCIRLVKVNSSLIKTISSLLNVLM